MNQQEDDDSEFNFTTTESSLPPLERNSRLGSECGEETKQHERYSRSHERPREPNVAIGVKQVSKRYTQHEKKSSNNNSIVIHEQAISLAHGDPQNKRSEQFSIPRDYSFENRKDESLTDIKASKMNMSEISASALNGRINKEKFQKVRQNLKLRKFSKSDKKDIILNPDSRSNSRKNRLASSSSSKGKLNLEEFSRMKYENEQLKGALSQIVMKFSNFSSQIAGQASNPKTTKTSESGSSIIWKDNYHSNNKYEINKDANAETETEMIKVEIGDEKDRKIQELLKQLKQKDSIIEKLQKELNMQKKTNENQ